MKEFDYCKFFRDIEADPYAMVEITVGQYYGAADHITHCKDCKDLAERIDRQNPEEPGIDLSTN